MKKLFFAFCICLSLLMIAGCGSSSNTSSGDKTTIKVGGTAISKVTYDAIKNDYEAKGYKTEFVTFDSNPVFLEACNNGDVDIVIGAHLKFVNSFNENKHGDLTMVKPYGYYTGIGLYSEKHKSIDEIPDGGKIAIMNDAMNMDIALQILQQVGLIKLKDHTGTATPADISENPKHLQIIDMDQAQTVTALNDMDAACVFFTHMSSAGKDPSTYLARDTEMIKYPMGVIVKKANANAKWATDYAECFKNADVRQAINKAFPGVFTFYDNDEQANG